MEYYLLPVEESEVAESVPAIRNFKGIPCMRPSKNTFSYSRTHNDRIAKFNITFMTRTDLIPYEMV